MRNSSDVKDKRITLENWKFRAKVEFYTGQITDCGLFESLKIAQKELEKYPPDVWDGYSVEDHRYREIDDGKPITKCFVRPRHRRKNSNILGHFSEVCTGGV